VSKINGGLRQLFRAKLPGFDWVSIESGSTGGGIPDSNYCVRTNDITGIEGWIEHKQTDGWAVTLRPEQVGWIARRVALRRSGVGCGAAAYIGRPTAGRGG